MKSNIIRNQVAKLLSNRVQAWKLDLNKKFVDEFTEQLKTATKTQMAECVENLHKLTTKKSRNLCKWCGRIIVLDIPTNEDIECDHCWELRTRIRYNLDLTKMFVRLYDK